MIPPDTWLYIYEIFEQPPSNSHWPDTFIGLWNEERFIYLFFTAPEDSYVSNILPKGATWSRYEIMYKDWQSGVPDSGFWSRDLFFAPADYTGLNNDRILLDPSVCFGDGRHPTTLSCLEFLHDTIAQKPVITLLDLGTGTGVLSLAAARLGVGNVLAVDKNDLAYKTTLKNVKINSLQNVIKVKKGEARFFIDTPFDLVIANLPFSVLRDLIPLKNSALHTTWIVSGINENQGATLKELFCDQGFRQIGSRSANPWETFVVTKE